MVDENLRKFTCMYAGCAVQWVTAEKGAFKFCPEHRLKLEQEKEVRLLAGRNKICLYRNCARSFVDDSKLNTQRYCCKEHQRRETQCKRGYTEDRFRNPDPMPNITEEK